MEFLNIESKLLGEIQPVVEGQGYYLVDFTSGRNDGNLHVSIVIYKEDGITLDDCTRVHKTIFPRIELLEDARNIHLEVSSPGISRNIRHSNEFSVFIGKNVRILTEDDSEWIYGKITSTDKVSISLLTKDGTMNFTYSNIKKAKLE